MTWNLFGIDARGTAMNVNYFVDAQFITLEFVCVTPEYTDNITDAE